MEVVRRAQPWLGTLVEISLSERDERAFHVAFGAIAEIHRCMSYHSDESDLALLRRSDPGSVVAVSRHTVAVLRLAEWFFQQTGGLFDVSVGRKLVATGYLPRLDDRPLFHFTGNASDIEIVDDTHVCCRRPMLIDLGGIAKGYAVDAALNALVEHGCAYAVVNAGGDLRHMGVAPETIWLRGADGIISHQFQIVNAAVATSSNLLFRRRQRGKQVSPHIGRNLTPLLTDATVTALAPECAFADAVTKVGIADRALAQKILDSVGGSLFTILNQGEVA